jgi:hypothetical protein
MKRHGSDLEPELEALLEPCKIQRQVPPELRARVLSRARATLAAGGATPPLPTPERARPTLRPARARRLVGIAIAASIALAAGAVGAAAALLVRSARPVEVAPPQSAAPAPKAPITHVAKPASERLAPDAETAPASRALRPAPAGAKADPFTGELNLLQGAQAAYTRRDFPVALTLIAEHARRFPKGHLAEQREALRVRSLVGAGRTDEAQRAAAAFAIRFPRSVLLPRVAGGSESPER